MICSSDKCQNDACSNPHRLHSAFTINGTQRYNFCCIECLLAKLRELEKSPENKILSTRFVH